MKLTKILATSAVCVFFSGTTAFAGQWVQTTDATSNTTVWKWQLDNTGTQFASNGWYWIDGNNDGLSECYYFDENGKLLVSQLTPDNYWVNEDGAWSEGSYVYRHNADGSSYSPETDNEDYSVYEGTYHYHGFSYEMGFYSEDKPDEKFIVTSQDGNLYIQGDFKEYGDFYNWKQAYAHPVLLTRKPELDQYSSERKIFVTEDNYWFSFGDNTLEYFGDNDYPQFIKD